MAIENDGGPAFPETRWDDKNRQDVQWPGMTMRDYFAGQALAGLLASGVATENGLSCADVAAMSYELADAMLEARNK